MKIYFLILTCTITGYVSISPFGCLLGIPIEIASSVIALNICAIAAASKKYKSIIKKKQKKHYKIVLLAISN